MRKKHKIAVAAVCCAGFLAAAGAGLTMAQSPTILAGIGRMESASAGPGAQEENEMGPYRIWGTVLEVEGGRIVLDNQSGNSYQGEVVLNISEEKSRILDAENGYPIQLSEIRKGETIYAYIGPAMTMSLPPQTTAEMVIGKLPADFKAPEYIRVKSMEQQENGDWTLTSTEGTTYHVAADTMIIPYLTRQIVTLDDVTVGRRLMVWSDDEGSAKKLVLFAE